jgi:murein L,D-transpeptidase YcbB/YkuD
MKKGLVLYNVFIISFVLNACTNNVKKNYSDKENDTVPVDSSVTLSNAFNDLFLDSTKLQSFIDKHPEYTIYEKQYFYFYKQRNYEYAWFDTSGIGEQASNFMNLLNTTVIESNDNSLYNKKLTILYSGFVSDSTKHLKSSPLQTELYLTGQFFEYASKVYNNKNVSATALAWFIPKKKFDLTRLLDSLIVAKGRGEDNYLPLNEQYKLLQEELAKYYNIQKNNSWDPIAEPKKRYRPGESSPAIAEIKERLFLLGDLREQDTTKLYDAALTEAVKSFQHRMALQETGIIDKTTMKKLNYPISETIKEILVNLERVRWMPPESHSNYIVVNIPEYKLYVYDKGQLQFDMNVIVGKEGTGTVIFTGDLKYIVFSPYWNVPSSIVEKEIVPAMDSDPHYLEEQDIEFMGYNSKWEPIIRQKPGEKNSLGLVKFLFPNNYNIYLHDTPFKDLFSLRSRSFSHGCIRLEDARKIALYLLRDEPEYTPEKVDSLMHLEQEKWVTLKKPVRVSITYFTAWVDSDGKLNFRKDIYGHDEEMANKLFMKG